MHCYAHNHYYPALTIVYIRHLLQHYSSLPEVGNSVNQLYMINVENLRVKSAHQQCLLTRLVTCYFLLLQSATCCYGVKHIRYIDIDTYSMLTFPTWIRPLWTIHSRRRIPFTIQFALLIQITMYSRERFMLNSKDTHLNRKSMRAGSRRSGKGLGGFFGGV